MLKPALFLALAIALLSACASSTPPSTSSPNGSDGGDSDAVADGDIGAPDGPDTATDSAAGALGPPGPTRLVVGGVSGAGTPASGETYTLIGHISPNASRTESGSFTLFGGL